MLLLKDLLVEVENFRLEVEKLRIDRGEYCLLVGPSGSGKSTLLETLVGLRKVKKGRITLEGKDITDLPPERREITIVYQDYLLFPHLTVFENIAFGLRKKVKEKARRRREVLKISEELGIEHLLDKKPSFLSGGEKQRVALARALVVRPKLLLLDEPLSALDPHTRKKVRKLIASTVRRHNITTLHVSHDLEDLQNLGEKAIFLYKGKVLQTGTAEELLKRPFHPKVAEFVGTNTLKVKVASTSPLKVKLGNHLLEVGRFRGVPKIGKEGLLHFQPSAAVPQNGENPLEGEVLSVSYERSLLSLTLKVEGQTVEVLLPKALLKKIPKEGERFRFSVPRGELFLNLDLPQGKDFVP